MSAPNADEAERKWLSMIDAAQKSWREEEALVQKHASASHVGERAIHDDDDDDDGFDEDDPVPNHGRPKSLHDLSDHSKRNQARVRLVDEPAVAGLGDDRPDMQGVLAKRGQRVKTWKTRFAVVKNGVVRYYVTEEAYHMNAQPRGAFRIKAGWKVEAGLKGHDTGSVGFYFRTGPSLELDAPDKRCWVFAARTAAERDEWVDLIQDVIDSLSAPPEASFIQPQQQVAPSLSHIHREGMLFKRGLTRKNWKQRFMVLGGDVLRYYTSQRVFIRQLHPRGGFRVGPSWTVQSGVEEKDFDPKLGFLFSVGPEAGAKQRVWVFGAASQSERDEWMAAFNTVIRLLQ